LGIDLLRSSCVLTKKLAIALLVLLAILSVGMTGFHYLEG